MLINMKPTRKQIRDLEKQLSRARKRNPLTNAEIGQLASVHPSQVGRICNGNFRTISNNVVQVCRVLGIELETVAKPARKRDTSWLRLESSIRNLWDQTPEGARRIAKILDKIAELCSR